MDIVLLIIGIVSVISTFMVAGKMLDDNETGKALTFIFFGTVLLCSFTFIAIGMYHDYLIKYIPNLEELYEDGKILEAEQKLEEMKLERLNIED